MGCFWSKWECPSLPPSLAQPHPSSSSPCASENDKLPSCSGGLSASFVTLSQACSRIICNLLSRKRKQQRPGEKQRLLTHIPGGWGGAEEPSRDGETELWTWRHGHRLSNSWANLNREKKTSKDHSDSMCYCLLVLVEARDDKTLQNLMKSSRNICCSFLQFQSWPQVQTGKQPMLLKVEIEVVGDILLLHAKWPQNSPTGYLQYQGKLKVYY